MLAAKEFRVDPQDDDAEQIFRSVTSNHEQQPLTPGLFFDSYREFDFEIEDSHHHVNNHFAGDLKRVNRASLNYGAATELITRPKHVVKQSYFQLTGNDGSVFDHDGSAPSDLPFRNLHISGISDNIIIQTEISFTESLLTETRPSRACIARHVTQDVDLHAFCVNRIEVLGGGLGLSEASASVV